jgi:acyl-CoA thioesterase FadM
MDGRKYAEGASKLVWIDLASGRPVPIPEAVVAPLRALDGAHAAPSRGATGH